MNSFQVSRIVLRGFKSIRECDLEIKELNILIGPNGAGKSNFIGFFSLIIVADRTEGFTNLHRLNSKAQENWLNEYSLLEALHAGGVHESY